MQGSMNSDCMRHASWPSNPPLQSMCSMDNSGPLASYESGMSMNAYSGPFTAHNSGSSSGSMMISSGQGVQHQMQSSALGQSGMHGLHSRDMPIDWAAYDNGNVDMSTGHRLRMEAGSGASDLTTCTEKGQSEGEYGFWGCDEWVAGPSGERRDFGAAGYLQPRPPSQQSGVGLKCMDPLLDALPSDLTGDFKVSEAAGRISANP
eukprot:jgi/Ulvmu1/7483/UM037_0027.1